MYQLQILPCQYQYTPHMCTCSAFAGGVIQYDRCTHSQCSVAEVDASLEEVRAKYRALPKEAQDEVLLRDFERMWEEFRSDVEKRATRR